MRKFLRSRKFLYFSLGLVFASAIAVASIFAYAAIGDVKLMKENVIITTPEVDILYDGQEHVFNNQEIKIEEGHLNVGDYIQVSEEEKRYTKAGTYTNRINVKILDSNNQDVSSTYNLKVKYGDIRISQRELDISVKDGVNYAGIEDGQTLTDSEVNWGRDGLASGDTGTVRVKKKYTDDSRTTYDFQFYGLKITNFNGENVTDCYTQIKHLNLLDRPDIDVPWIDFDDLPPFDWSGIDFDSLDDLPIGDLPFDQINAPVMDVNASKPGVYYFRGQSYGNYDVASNTFMTAQPYYLNYSSYNPNQYMTNIEAQRSKIGSAEVHVSYREGLFGTDYDFVPYFIDTDQKQSNDISFHMNQSNYTGEFDYLCYPDIPQLALDEIESTSFDDAYLSNEEENYRDFVYSQYLDIDYSLQNNLLRFIDEKNLDTSSVSKFVSSLTNLFYSEYEYNLEPFSGSLMEFLEDEKVGNCQNFASSGTMLFRAIGIPARLTTGFPCIIKDPSETFTVYSLTFHAWSEIYLDGHGWIPIECTTGIDNLFDLDNILPGQGEDEETDEGLNKGDLDDLEDEYVPDENDNGNTSGITHVYDNMPNNYNYLFDVQTSNAGYYYLREESYGNFDAEEKGFDEANVYDVNDYYLNPNLYISNQLYSYGTNFNQVNIYNENPERVNTIVPAYASSTSYNFSQVDDVSFKNNGSTNNTYYAMDFNYRDNMYYMDSYFFSDYTLQEAEEKYSAFVEHNYLEVPSVIKSTIMNLIGNYVQFIPINNPSAVIPIISDYLSKASITYNPFIEIEDYDLSFEESVLEIIENNPAECDSELIASAATLLLRSLEIPTRLTKGYLYIAEDTNQVSISDTNEYYWNEVYIKGHGWVVVDFTRDSGLIDEKYYHGKQKLTLSLEGTTKDYDDLYVESTPYILEGDSAIKQNHMYSLSCEEMFKDAGVHQPRISFEVYDMSNNFENVTYEYALTYNIGEVVINKFTLTYDTNSQAETASPGTTLSSQIINIHEMDALEAMGITLEDIEYVPTYLKYSDYEDGITYVKSTVEIVAIYNEYGENIINNFDIKEGTIGTLEFR